MMSQSTQYTIGSLAKSRVDSPNIQKTTEIEQERKVTLHFNFPTAETMFKDFLPIIEANGLFQLTYIGNRGFGKTSSSEDFATVAEKHGFLTIYGKAEDILPDLNGWIEKAIEKIRQHGNPYVTFVLDDMSYSTGMISEKKAATFKHFAADIRHVFEKVYGTIKIFLILISHRYHAVPPMLRSAVSWIFASLDNEDRNDAMKMLTKDKDQQQRLDKIYRFLQEVTVIGPRDKGFYLGSGNKRVWFRWGTEEDPGDGRLMMSYHQGKIGIFNPRRTENMVTLENCRFHYEPKEFVPGVMYRQIECQVCGHKNQTKKPDNVRLQCTKCRKVIQREK